MVPWWSGEMRMALLRCWRVEGQYFSAHWPSREPADQEIVETFCLI